MATERLPPAALGAAAAAAGCCRRCRATPRLPLAGLAGAAGCCCTRASARCAACTCSPSHASCSAVSSWPGRRSCRPGGQAGGWQRMSEEREPAGLLIVEQPPAAHASGLRPYARHSNPGRRSHLQLSRQHGVALGPRPRALLACRRARLRPAARGAPAAAAPVAAATGLEVDGISAAGAGLALLACCVLPIISRVCGGIVLPLPRPASGPAELAAQALHSGVHGAQRLLLVQAPAIVQPGAQRQRVGARGGKRRLLARGRRGCRRRRRRHRQGRRRHAAMSWGPHAPQRSRQGLQGLQGRSPESWAAGGPRGSRTRQLHAFRAIGDRCCFAIGSGEAAGCVRGSAPFKNEARSWRAAGCLAIGACCTFTVGTGRSVCRALHHLAATSAGRACRAWLNPTSCNLTIAQFQSPSLSLPSQPPQGPPRHR